MHQSPDFVPSAGFVMETLIRTTHRLHQQFEHELAARDIPPFLTGPRLRLLIMVEEAGRIRMSELAAKLGIQPRTVTQFVDALEQEQLLIRTPDPVDRRATYLQLCDTAPPLMRKARAAMSDSAEQVLGWLPQEERKLLVEILLRSSHAADN